MKEEKLNNPMRRLKIAKVTINVGVGDSGEKLLKAEKMLKYVIKQILGKDRQPIKTLARKTIQTWNIRRGQPIGLKLTLRGEDAIKFLDRAFDAIDRKLPKSVFDNEGNFSFGIARYIDIPGIKYDPDIGIFGMDVCVTLERPGYRIKYRKRCRVKKIPKSHRVTKEEAIEFIKNLFNVNII